MRRRSLVLAVSLVTGAVLAGSGAIAATVTPSGPAVPAPAAEWGNAISVPVSVTAISCPAAGDCVAAGTESAGAQGAQQGYVIEESGGKWHKPRPIPGLAALNSGGQAKIDSISCSAPGNCSAGGYYATSLAGAPPGLTQAQPFVVTETAGVWGSAQEVPGSAAANENGGIAQVMSVSCAAPGDCAAVGDITHHTTAPMFVVDEKSGVWGTLRPVSGAAAGDAIYSVSCAAPGECLAGGGFPASSAGAFLVQETGGTWGPARAVAGLAALPGGTSGSEVTAVSCPSAGNCAVTGRFGVSGEFVADESGGTWRDARAVTGLTGSYSWTGALTCAAAGNCALAGWVVGASGLPTAYVASESGGSWGGSKAIPGLAAIAPAGAMASEVSCPSAGDCTVAGDYYPIQLRTVPFVADEVHGTWGKAQPVPGARGKIMAALSCASPLSCVAGGDGFLAEKSTARRTTLGLSVTRASAPYGHEQAERVLVRVTADSGTPSGTVVVKARSGTLCAITLAGGRGGCAVPARRFAPGKVVLTATYGGAPGFTAALPATVEVSITRDTTKTALRLSASVVKFGHESAERLTVTVTPGFARPAPGRVILRAGKQTVCVITLRDGTGSCRLGARQLAAGTYTVVARYPGTPSYAPSTSASRKLTVRH